MGFLSFPTGTGGAPEPVERHSVKGWCRSIGLDYDHLIEIPETDIRTLMTMHESCDLLYEWMLDKPEDFDEFAADKNAMKWIGLRDYICDKLMSIESVSEKMLGGDFWEYILKDKVPTMTSNTEPYGEALCGQGSGASKSTVSEAWKPFANDTVDTCYGGSGTASTSWVQYKFVNPTRINKVAVNDKSSSFILYTFKVQYSNDGTNWTDASDTLDARDNQKNNWYYYDCSNGEYAMYWRFQPISSLNNYKVRVSLQFYGRTDTHDYSEHTERLYLYDHGVKLVDFDFTNFVGQSASHIRDKATILDYPDYIFAKPGTDGTNTTSAAFGTNDLVHFDRNEMRMVYDITTVGMKENAFDVSSVFGRDLYISIWVAQNQIAYFRCQLLENKSDDSTQHVANYRLENDSGSGIPANGDNALTLYALWLE